MWSWSLNRLTNVNRQIPEWTNQWEVERSCTEEAAVRREEKAGYKRRSWKLQREKMGNQPGRSNS